MKATKSSVTCDCGKKAKKVFSVPSIQTDTSFFATGQYDNRLCNGQDDKIQGRKDWDRRLKEKNLVEIDRGFLNRPVPKPEPVFD